jgi:hypothetical protein
MAGPFRWIHWHLTMQLSLHKSRKMLSTAEAAIYCGSSASTFSKLRVFGGGPVFIKIGYRVVYDPSDLDRWLAARRRTSTDKHLSGPKTCFVWMKDIAKEARLPSI